MNSTPTSLRMERPSVLIPFDLVTVDSKVTTSADGNDGAAIAAAGGGDAEAPPVVMHMLELCQKRYLSDPGIVRDRAAFLLSKLLTRPDMPNALRGFLTFATDALARASRPKDHTRGADVMTTDETTGEPLTALELAAREQEATFLGAFSLHWSPYDRVGAVNADP
jgi:hypothetical protein